jgi:hypothetical protein
MPLHCVYFSSERLKSDIEQRESRLWLIIWYFKEEYIKSYTYSSFLGNYLIYIRKIQSLIILVDTIADTLPTYLLKYIWKLYSICTVNIPSNKTHRKWRQPPVHPSLIKNNHRSASKSHRLSPKSRRVIIDTNNFRDCPLIKREMHTKVCFLLFLDALSLWENSPVFGIHTRAVDYKLRGWIGECRKGESLALSLPIYTYINRDYYFVFCFTWIW